MKRINVEQNTEEWLRARDGKIMGSAIKDIYSSLGLTKEKIVDYLNSRSIAFNPKAKKEELESIINNSSKVELMLDGEEKKSGYYKLIVSMMGIVDDEDEYADENPMNRGHIMEPIAVEAFEQATGKVCTLEGIWISEASERIAISPDRGIKGTKDTEALEVKCLAPWKHIRAILTNKVPEGSPEYYNLQKIQYFIANEKLQTLYYAFYNPLCKFKPLHIIEVHRADVLEDIAFFTAYQLEIIKQAEADVEKLLWQKSH